MVHTLKDVGIDIIQINKDESIVFVQGKNYTCTLNVNDLAGFWMMIDVHKEKYGIVYHSNDIISKNIKKFMIDDRIKFIHQSTDVNNDVNNSG